MTEGQSKLERRIQAVLDSASDRFDDLVTAAGLDPTADLQFGDWHGLDLTGIDLRRFNFTGADLTGAIFEGALVAGAVFDNATFDATSLRAAADWERIIHPKMRRSQELTYAEAHFDNVYLAPAEFVDSDHPAIKAFVAETVSPHASLVEKAKQLYLAAREIRYDPDLDFSDPDVYRASSVLQAGYGYSVGKAALFAALARAAGVPARVGFADVTNHLASENLHKKMGTNYFAWDGFTEVLLGDQWLKASPTFNATLCGRFGVAPLDFDGHSDALLQPYDGAGRTFMRYEVMHGAFHDVPVKFLIAEMARRYPSLKNSRGRSAGGMENEVPLARA